MAAQHIYDPITAVLDQYQRHLVQIIEDENTLPELRRKALLLLAHISIVLAHDVRDSRAVYLN